MPMINKHMEERKLNDNYREEALERYTWQMYIFTIENAQSSIGDLCEMCYTLNRQWHLDPETGEDITRNHAELFALMHSEISEALEGHRKNLQSDKIPEFTSVEEELADLIIRVFDYAGRHDLRLGEAFVAKTIYNATRPDHSLSARREKNGKKY